MKVRIVLTIALIIAAVLYILGQEALFFIFIGLAIMGAGGYALIVKRSLFKDGVRVHATILKVERKRLRNDVWTHIPTLGYTVDGHTYEIEHHGSAKPKYKEGDTMEVVYSQSDPERVRIVGDNFQYIGTAIFIFIGALLSGFGIWVLTL